MTYNLYSANTKIYFRVCRKRKMEYRTLETFYHMDSSSSRDVNLLVELDVRRNAPSSFGLGIETPHGELFLAIPRELSVLNERVLRRERKVSNLMRQLPGIAGDEVLRSMVLDEVVGSNAIENVHSTRRQIEEALSSTRQDLQGRRFREFARLYLDLMYGTSKAPHTPEDIRAIYDKIMDGETLEDSPDGVLFRKEPVKVTDGIKPLHEGLYPEEEITKAMQGMLALVNSPEIPSLYGALTSHFVFEYAHPFYDGNGRTGRYLLSLFLEESLSKATSLSLSRVIQENKMMYYNAFKKAEHPLNHGELTFFVYDMLELILSAQDELIRRYEENVMKLNALQLSCAALEDASAFSDKELSFLFVLAQYKAFGVSESASLDTLANHVELGQQQARKYMARLEECGAAQKTKSRRPIMFAMTDEFAEKWFPATSVEEIPKTVNSERQN